MPRPAVLSSRPVVGAALGLALIAGLAGAGCGSSGGVGARAIGSGSGSNGGGGTQSPATPRTQVLAKRTINGAGIPCAARSATDFVRVCYGGPGSAGGTDLRIKTWDGIPLEGYVTLPPVPATGTDGHYPLIVLSHGYGNSAVGPDNAEYGGLTAAQYAAKGYAVLQLSARGFGASCGTPASRTVNPSLCTAGWIHLDDQRYEIRDIQTVVGFMVDDGLVDATRIGLSGESYGAGASLQAAILRNRVEQLDGTLIPWTSPAGVPLTMAAAAMVAPWTDLFYSLVPNGRTLDSAVPGAKADFTPIGVEKLSFLSGLYALGQENGFYAPPQADASADINTWYAAIDAGEPYESNPEIPAIITAFMQYRSPFYLQSGAYGVTSQAPPPLFLESGWADDLFPVDESVRLANLLQSQFPGVPVNLWAMDIGHPRSQVKAADLAVLDSAIARFFDYYLMGQGAQPAPGAYALTEACPSTAVSEGLYYATSWAGLRTSTVAYDSTGTAQATQTVLSQGGDPSIGKTIDPIAGGGACATVAATDQGTGVATYRLPAATGAGYTLIGAPVVTATLAVTGEYPYLAARLWDVDPTAGTETLVDRGVYRIDNGNSNGAQTFQLHPGGWHFLAGHIPKLELVGQDAPYVRVSNGQFSVAVANLTLSLPVR